MKRRREVPLGLIAAPLAAPALAAPPMKRLFDGRSLAGWTPQGDANWRVADGAICADAGQVSFLVSNEAWRDFELAVEIWVSPDANSGVFIRCSDPAHVTASNAYEVNVFDTRPDPSYGTGAIVNLAKVSPMPKAGGRWSLMRITARGDAFTVVFNGRKTVDGVRDGAHPQGPIALQYGAGVVKFRRVDIRPL